MTISLKMTYSMYSAIFLGYLGYRPKENPKTFHLVLFMYQRYRQNLNFETQNSHVGHVHLIFVGVDFIRVGSLFSVKYGLEAHIPLKSRSALGTDHNSVDATAKE